MYTYFFNFEMSALSTKPLITPNIIRGKGASSNTTLTELNFMGSRTHRPYKGQKSEKHFQFGIHQIFTLPQIAQDSKKCHFFTNFAPQ